LLRGAIGKFLGDSVQLVDSAENCARAVSQLLEKKSLRATPDAEGELSVALTDPPDVFLEVARQALQLKMGEVELRPVMHIGGTGAVGSAAARLRI